MKLKVRLILIRLIVMAFLGSTAMAQTTRLLPFQGRLTEGSGLAVPDGLKLIQFQIYGEPIGGGALWAGEVHRTTVNGGLVNVMLGSKNPLPVNRADNPDRSFFDASLYLQITVDGNNDGKIDQADPPLLPRQAILPVIFANESANSHKLNGYDWRVLFGSSNPETGTLLDGKVRDGSITAGKLKPGTITAAQLASGTVTSNQIGNAMVDLSNLAQQITERLCPAGTIVAFGGPASQIPVGWLLCDGKASSSGQFPNLFGRIGRTWGAGELGSTNDFNLPDLRGVFLRGISAGRSDSYADPDVSNRVNLFVGGNTGNTVGTFQSDQFGKHNHQEHPGQSASVYFQRFNGPGGTWPSERDGNILGQQTGDAGGSETRPKNAAVLYIIKY